MMPNTVSAAFGGLALTLASLTIAPLSAVAQTASAPAAPAPTAALSSAESTIGTLFENPAAKAIVDKHIPGLSSNASIGMASGMTLRAIQPMSGNMITTAMLDAIDADLAKLPSRK